MKCKRCNRQELTLIEGLCYFCCYSLMVQYKTALRRIIALGEGDDNFIGAAVEIAEGVLGE